MRFFDWLFRYNKIIDKYWDDHYEKEYHNEEYLKAPKLGKSAQGAVKKAEKQMSQYTTETPPPPPKPTLPKTPIKKVIPARQSTGSQETPTRESTQDPKVTVGKPRPTLTEKTIEEKEKEAKQFTKYLPEDKPKKKVSKKKLVTKKTIPTKKATDSIFQPDFTTYMIRRREK